MSEHLASPELHPDTSSNSGGATDSTLLLRACSFLSYTVVVNTFFYKAPQVYAIVHSGSSLGVSLTSVVLEWIAYSIMLTYHYAMDYPLETYLEIVLMVIQDCLLTIVILGNRNMIKRNLIPYAFAYLLGFLAIALHWLPSTLMIITIVATCHCLISYGLGPFHTPLCLSVTIEITGRTHLHRTTQGITTPILCWSKIDQLVEILWTKDPGSLSTLSWFIAVYDTGVRILTTLVITKDLPMLINLTSSEVLNIAVFASIVYYNFRKQQRGWKPVELSQ